MSINLSLKQRRNASKTTKNGKRPARLIGVNLFVVTFFSVAVVTAHFAPPARVKTSLAVPSIRSAVTTTPIISPATSAAEFPSGNWEIATPQEVGMDPALFAAAMDKLPSPSVVIRNGRIVGQKGDITRAGYIWSASKSLVALIGARLIQQGQIGYDDVIPGSDVPSSPTATLRHFMSLTSDYNLTPHSPGNHYAYNNGAVHFYGKYLNSMFYSGKTEVQMLQDAYVSALGFQDALSYNTAGYLSGWDGGWSMSTRDMARIAYLALKGGEWAGTQLVSPAFIDALYQNQIPVGATQSTDEDDQFYNQELSSVNLPGAYSFGFWLPHKRAIGGSQSQTEAITMLGAFGTTVHISRSKDLVIVAVNTTPNDHGGAKISGAVLDMFAASIIGSTPTPTPTPTPTLSQGRIAISSDGNDHDCDDITATAMSIALLAKTGNASRLVYYGHSDHIWSTGLDGACSGGNREEEMRISAEETAKLWGGFNLGVFINAKAQTSTAVAALTAQINASSATDPLWIIGAGPMEVIGRALSASDINKRQYVTVVSHSEWNDYHAEQPGHGTWNFFELGSVLGANLKHIIDQNPGLRVHESNYSWLQHSSDPKLDWLWQRHQKSGLSPDFDPSDAGMIYWLITGGNNGGDQNATPAKLRTILESATSPTPTPTPTPTPIPAPTPTPNPTPTTSLAAVLVTAPDGTPLYGVSSGTIVNLATLPTRSLSIKVVPSASVGSIRLQFNGQDRTENVAPYAVAGDINGVFNPADISVGTHTLTATAYSQPNLGGTAGASTTISFAVVDSHNTPPPTLLTDENSDRAIAFNAATFVSEPFAVFTEHNLSSDKRTRVMLFVTNFESLRAASDAAVYADSTLGTVPLPIEYIGRVPNFDWLTQIKVLLPDVLANTGEVWLRVSLHGVSSNQARISISQPAVAATMPPSRMTLLVDSWIAPKRRLQVPIATGQPRAS